MSSRTDASTPLPLLPLLSPTSSSDRLSLPFTPAEQDEAAVASCFFFFFTEFKEATLAALGEQRTGQSPDDNQKQPGACTARLEAPCDLLSE